MVPEDGKTVDFFVSLGKGTVREEGGNPTTRNGGVSATRGSRDGEGKVGGVGDVDIGM